MDLCVICLGKECMHKTSFNSERFEAIVGAKIDQITYGDTVRCGEVSTKEVSTPKRLGDLAKNRRGFIEYWKNLIHIILRLADLYDNF